MWISYQDIMDSLELRASEQGNWISVDSWNSKIGNMDSQRKSYIRARGCGFMRLYVRKSWSHRIWIREHGFLNTYHGFLVDIKDSQETKMESQRNLQIHKLLKDVDSWDFISGNHGFIRAQGLRKKELDFSRISWIHRILKWECVDS